MAKKRCIKCAEIIQWRATVCHYCQAEQPPVEGKEPKGPIVKGCMWVAGGFIGLFFLLVLIGSIVGPQSVTETSQDECIEKGVAYFKEIGSYPYLSSYPNAGRAAEDVAAERCERSPIAFDGAS